jgi:hypothetical protein
MYNVPRLDWYRTRLIGLPPLFPQIKICGNPVRDLRIENLKI